MPKFEVYIPALETTGFNFTFRVDAENWMAALKMGMHKLGEQGAHGVNVLVDIRDDNSLHVTESESGRVFRIRELSEQEAASVRLKKTGSYPAAPPVPVPAPAREHPTLPPHHPHHPHHRKNLHHEPDEVVELEHPTRPVSGLIGRAREKPRSAEDEIDSQLADVFERVQEIYNQPNERDAMYYLLDLALEKIPAEAGSVFGADTGSGDLSFIAVRGPKATELLRAKLVIPAGTGIVGFCALEGVSVALSDVQKDPRYYAAVAAKVNFETRSVLCSPMMTHGRTFGCLQIINRKGSALFGEHEVGMLAYIAHQGALYLNARS